MRLFTSVHLLVNGGFFLYNFTMKGVKNMEGYDNDSLLLMLDDDLFPVDEESKGESEK